MKISILIITRKRLESELSAKKALLLGASGVETEVLIAEGDNPSMQRNKLAEIAQGDYLLFFDNDSEPDCQILSFYKQSVDNFPEAKIFGGPSLLKIDETALNFLSRLFFSSLLGIGPMKNRYNSLGNDKEASEKDLILSNMLIEKKYFMEKGGFDKNLYPSEENEFINREKSKSRIIYSSNARVYRFPRSTLRAFLKQMFSYGEGRSKHLGITSHFIELIFLIPAAFCLYILSLPICMAIASSSSFTIYMFPLMAYFSLIWFSSCFYTDSASFKTTGLSPFFFLLGHFCYGLGICSGIYKYKLRKKYIKQRKLTYFNLEKIKEFKIVS